jgi:CRP/FNR family transcriptional regulator
VAKPVDPTISRLAAVDLFEGFSKKELGALRDAAREAVAAPGEAIVREGDHDRRFYLILSGSAQVTFNGAPVRTIGPGDYFGEVSVIDGGERTATVTALTPVTLLTLAHFNIKAIVREHPDVAFKLMVGLCGVLRRNVSRANAH